jgi:hypothetical protein
VLALDLWGEGDLAWRAGGGDRWVDHGPSFSSRLAFGLTFVDVKRREMECGGVASVEGLGEVLISEF